MMNIKVVDVHEAATFADIDTAKLRELISRGFGRPVRDTLFEREVSRILIAGNHIGAAILVDTELGTYMTKFVVEPSVRGRGIGEWCGRES